MPPIQHFKTFLALIIFSFIFFNYAKGENPKKSDVQLKEWEEHHEKWEELNERFEKMMEGKND